MSVHEGRLQRSHQARWFFAVLSVLTIIGISRSWADWADDFRLTDNSTASQNAEWNNSWAVANGPDGIIYVVWQDDATPTRIYFKVYTPGGGWSGDTLLSVSNPSYDQVDAAAACDAAGNLHVVWYSERYSTENGQLCYRKRDIVSGLGTIEEITSGNFFRASPSIAVGAGDTVHVAWGGKDAGGSIFQIFHRSRGASGWLSAEQITSGSYSQIRPSIAAEANGDVHLAWYGASPPNGYLQVFYTRRTGGSWWPSAEAVTSTPNSKAAPSVALDGSHNVHVVWDQIDGESPSYHQVYYAHRTTEWQSPVVLTSGALDSERPSIAADGLDRLHVVWKSGDVAGKQLYYEEYIPGSGWQSIEQLTNATGIKERASVRCDADGHPNLVWSDCRDGNSEIYYKGPPILDVGVLSILAPADTLRGMQVMVSAQVRNYSTSTQDVRARFRIPGTPYNDVRTKSVPARTSDTVIFAPWTPADTGVYTPVCSTELDGDENHSNDRKSSSMRVNLLDASALRINVFGMADTVDSGAVVTPTAWIRNMGTAFPNPVTIQSRMKLSGTSYNNTQSRSFVAGESLAVTFTNWTAAAHGAITAKCTTELSRDQVPANNLQTRSIFVRVRDVGVAVTSPTSGQTVGIGSPVVCQATLTNHGNVQRTVDAVFSIRDANNLDRPGTPFTQIGIYLAAGAAQPVTFAAGWIADTLASLVAKCSLLTADQVPSNDFHSVNFTVVGHDISCEQLYSPSGTVDSGIPVRCSTRVKNKGAFSEPVGSGWVKLWIGAWRDSIALPALAVNEERRLVFGDAGGWWTPSLRGSATAKCTVMLNGDDNTANDRKINSLLVRVRDIATDSITWPLGTVDSGMTASPTVWISNRGNTQETGVRLRLRIGTAIVDSLTNQTVSAGASLCGVFTARQMNFARTATPAVTCTTYLSGSGELITGNNQVYQTLAVRVRDVAMVSITSPPLMPATVDSGYSVQPVVRVRNPGSTRESLSVTVKIGAWSSTIPKVVLDPSTAGWDTGVTTPGSWTANQRDSSAVRCTVALLYGTDANAGNNLLTGKVMVMVHDVALVSILSPVGNLPESVAASVVPVVANPGNSSEPFRVHFRIDSLPGFYCYNESTPPITVAPGAQYEVSGLLPDWLPTPERQYRAIADVYLASDQVRSNDTFLQAFAVNEILFRDAGVRRIIQPYGVGYPGPLLPMAMLVNNGETTETPKVFFHISSDSVLFRDSLTATIGAGDSQAVSFARWSAQPGNYTALCSLTAAVDSNPGNNTVRVTFRIDSLAPGTWHDLAGVPPGLKGKRVRNGAGLACRPGSAEIYAVKGNNTYEFYVYDMNSDIWATRESVPYSPEKKKRVNKGAALAYASSNDRLYLLKGNGTNEFWVFDPVNRFWEQKTRIPVDRLRGGTAMCYVEQDSSFYVLSGSKTLAFWRYSVPSDAWFALTGMPAGDRGKPVSGGAALAYDGLGTVYALKGNNTYEFYSYDVAHGAWNALLPIPLGLKKKKVKDGAALAANAIGNVFALKGNGTYEFYSYDPAAQYWTPRQSVPIGASSKGVKAGGSVVLAAGKLYALKGNNTPEFRYFDAAGFLFGSQGDGGTRVAVTSAATGFAVSPNPTSGMLGVECRNGSGGLLTVFDLSGRRVVVRSLRPETPIRLDLHACPAGVYLMVFDAQGRKQVQKLVIER